jgi:acyl-CoA thioester hydrolase
MTVTERFETSIEVRGYELDPQGHVRRTVYLDYAEHARWEWLRAAGVDQAAMLASGVGPVTLEETIRYRHELRSGDEVVVSCVFTWTGGKTLRVEQEFRRADGTLVAELSSVFGLLDLAARRLVPDPAQRLVSLATTPELLGVA